MSDIESVYYTWNAPSTGGPGLKALCEPTEALPDMTRDPTRYLTPDDRDFFAVFARGG